MNLKALYESKRSWKEDLELENGQYTCHCLECGKDFIGHKLRLICRECAKQEEERTIYTDRR